MSIKNRLLAFRVQIQNHDYLSSDFYQNVMICKLNFWKALYSSLAEHVLLAANAANQSKEEPEIVTDEER